MANRDDIIAAIRIVQARLIWKPGSAERHLTQRIRRGHLPKTATIDQYEAIIRAVLHGCNAYVYIFWYGNTPYISIIDDVDDKQWLVMFALNGVLGSAYIVERPDRYLNKVGFEYVDLLAKVTLHDD